MCELQLVCIFVFVVIVAEAVDIYSSKPSLRGSFPPGLSSTFSFSQKSAGETTRQLKHVIVFNTNGSHSPTQA